MYDSETDLLNKRYWIAKDGDPSPIQTGFRVWDSSSATSAKYSGDAEVVVHELYDFPEIERPPEPEPEE